MYLRTCGERPMPGCFMTASSLAPYRPACVARPARKLWPAKSSMCKPTRAVARPGGQWNPDVALVFRHVELIDRPEEEAFGYAGGVQSDAKRPDRQRIHREWPQNGVAP